MPEEIESGRTDMRQTVRKDDITPKFKHPNISDIFNLGTSGFIVITGCDLIKQVGTFALVQSEREAKDFIHAVSLKQSPKWHKTVCPVCLASSKKWNFGVGG